MTDADDRLYFSQQRPEGLLVIAPLTDKAYAASAAPTSRYHLYVQHSERSEDVTVVASVDSDWSAIELARMLGIWP